MYRIVLSPGPRHRLLLVVSLFIFLRPISAAKGNPEAKGGPFSWPLIGSSAVVNKYCKKYGNLHRGFIELCKAYNSDILSLKFGRENVVVVQSQEFVEEIVARDEFLARPDSVFIRLRSMGTRKGITMTDGVLWREQRAFVTKHLINLGFGKTKMEYLIQEEVQEFLKLFHEGGSNIKLSPYIQKSVLNILWAMMTGGRFKENETFEALLKLLDERAVAFDFAGGLLGLFPWIRFIAPEKSGYNLIVRLNEKFKLMITEIIDQHKTSYNKNETRDFIDAFLHEMYNGDSENSTFTEDQLIMVCLDFFIAGSQTTSATVDYALLHMILHPDIQQKVQDELDNVIGQNQFVSSLDRNRLPYTDAVLLESQRLSTVVPFLGPRRVLTNTKLGDYDILKGTTIYANLVPLSMDTTKWDKPDEFSPERFMNEFGQTSCNKNHFPFGKGKRRCPGEPLAKNFMFTIFANLIHSFKLEKAEGHPPPSLGTISSLIQAPPPYVLKLTKRY